MFLPTDHIKQRGPVFGFFSREGANMPYVIGVLNGSGLFGVAAGGPSLKDLIDNLRLKYG